MNDEFDLTSEDGEEQALSLGGEELAQFGGEEVPVIAGLISGMSWGEPGGEFSCLSGHATVPLPPLAHNEGEPDGETPPDTWKVRPGLLQGFEFDNKVEKPTLDQGVVKFPLAQADSESCSGAVDGTPGAVCGIGYSDDGYFSITDGVARIPRPPELPSGISSFPAGLRNAPANQNITWEEFFSQTGVIPLSNPVNGFRISAFPFQRKYLSLLLEPV